MNAQLMELILKREDEQFDFKRRVHSAQKIAKTLAAFANAEGGQLLVGVSDDKNILGVDPEEEKHILNQAAHFNCRPAVTLDFEEIYHSEREDDFKEKTVLLVKVKAAENKPVYALDKSGEWKAYMRQRDKTVVAGRKNIKLITYDQPDPTVDYNLSNNEKRLVSFLEKNERINLKQYMKLVNISNRRARRELIEATEKGVIKVMEHESEDFYVI